MNIKDKILIKLFEDPVKKYYIRELAREIKVNPNSILNNLSELEKEGVLTRDNKKHIVEIGANLNNLNFIIKKRLYNLSQIYESKILDLLVKRYNPKSIVLFGSYSRGEDIKESDIDLAIITEEKNMINLEKFERTLKRKIHILLISLKDMPEELYSNLINGIILYGYLDKK